MLSKVFVLFGVSERDLFASLLGDYPENEKIKVSTRSFGSHTRLATFMRSKKLDRSYYLVFNVEETERVLPYFLHTRLDIKPMAYSNQAKQLYTIDNVACEVNMNHGDENKKNPSDHVDLRDLG